MQSFIPPFNPPLLPLFILFLSAWPNVGMASESRGHELGPRALTIESKFLHDLTRARSAHQIERLKQKYEELRVARGACLIQMRGHLVPTACYASLRLENGLGLYPSMTKRIELQRKLDAMCLEATRRLQPAGRGDEPGISSFCARRLREAHALQAYRRNDNHFIEYKN